MVDFRAGESVRIGERSSLTSVGVTGSAEELPAPASAARPAARDLRAPKTLTDAAEAAGLRDLGTDRMLTVRSTARTAGRPHVLIEQDTAPPPGEFRVALAATVGDDGYGMLTWHPMERSGAGRFTVERRAWNTARGWTGTLLVKVFGFAIEEVSGDVAEQLAARIEERRHRYRLRACLPASYGTDVADDLPGSAWPGLVTGGGERRTLLMLHGAFGRSHTAFGGLPAGTFAELHRAYGGRVIAFDHHTLIHDPAENVRRLIGLIPDGSDLRFDVLTHSRGGLVARELVRQAAATGGLGRRRLRIGKVVFAGTPNAGTTLADADRRDQLLDRMTTLLAVLGGGAPATEALTLVLELVKLAAAGVMAELPGLTSMDPGGAYLRGLGAARPVPGVTYHALGSDFEPSGSSMLLQDLAADLIFSGGNDLIVPSEGVRDLGSSGTVATGDALILVPKDAVHHSAYFSLPKPSAQILRWLHP
ncbi:esterase/lipase family protein [Spongiactinospora sp. 9N601]|uniref:esterase/lipase family protein n=1 Tax=Spongiactinospora sp. 9N601 TaxID=3375149 RepID=UPI0037B59803